MPRFVRVRKAAITHAKAARKAGYHVEAIHTLHAWIELQLRDLMLISGSNRRGKPADDDFGHAWDVSNEISYTAASSSAYVSGLINKTLYGNLKRFNSVRNSLIHKVFYEPYDKIYEGFPHKDYAVAFKLGVSLIEQVEELVQAALEVPSNNSLQRR
jgi:hypothetical protein